MCRFDLSELAAAWHRRQDRFEAVGWHFAKFSDEEDPDYELQSALDALLEPGGDPDSAWDVIVSIWASMDLRNTGQIGLFAASVMEDLIDQHGPVLIDRIEAKAKEDPEFRRMLLGVWPPADEDRADWQRIVKLVEDLGPVQSFKDRKKR